MQLRRNDTGIRNIIDAIDAALYIAEGDYVNAALTFAPEILGAGITTGIKAAKWVSRADKISDAGKAVATVVKNSVNIIDVGKYTAKYGNNIVEVGKGGLNSVDDIFTAGKKAFNNFDINNSYVKPKHLSITGGNGQKFIGGSKVETERILKDILSNGKIVSITDNGLTKAGNASYEIIIDAGKIIGTKNEKLVKIIISSDGGMLSAYPIK